MAGVPSADGDESARVEHLSKLVSATSCPSGSSVGGRPFFEALAKEVERYPTAAKKNELGMSFADVVNNAAASQ